MRAVEINIGANTNEPGFRGPVFLDGSFEYIPIPDDLADTRVHLDPGFSEYPGCERYTYGDEHGIKADPLSELAAGDPLLFYWRVRAGRGSADPGRDGSPTGGAAVFREQRPHEARSA